MPHYDESFFHDDDQNQRRNKRSYRVFKNGLSTINILEPSEVFHVLEERGSSVIKRNIKNIKYRGTRCKPEHLYPPLPIRYKNPDITVERYPKISTFDPKKYFDVRNNNFPLTPCKSVDNLTIKQNSRNRKRDKSLRNGISLQNLNDVEILKHYASPLEESSAQKGDNRSSYSVVDVCKKPPTRRLSRSTPAPGMGVYRPISCEGVLSRNSKEIETCEPGSGHRGSLRGANKLARRARSFKDDLLERISNMRSPGQQHRPPHLSSALRSHSPLSPKLRNMGNKGVAEEGEVTPAKELERLVKEVTFGLKHFSDVITKRKLEMLPDNGTIVFESIANIHKAIKPYCSRSPPLVSAVKRLCTALATLIRLCDEISSAPAEQLRLDAEHVGGVVRGVTAAVEEVAALAVQQLTRPALAPRPALVSPRAAAQRNSLPDIPLTPKERSLLTGEGVNESPGVRASHSSESVLDAPDTPPPKPARPNRKVESAPPLPPKRKSANDNSFLALSIDRLSLQSHSGGSLDSMLNVSNEDDRNMTDSNNHDNVFVTPPSLDTGVCSCVGNSTHDSSNNSHANFNHNRFSNESGFVSVGHFEISSDQNFSPAFSSHHYSSHTDSTFDSTDCVSELRCTRQSFESRMNVINMNLSTSQCTHQTVNTKLASITSDESETPPELPAKTRINIRADLQQHFPNVEIRSCVLHGARPHTLAPTRPPPLPLKKKHIMAYMEMFGNCSHPPSNSTAAPDMFRHSIHTYNLSSAQHSSGGAISVQRHQQVQRSIAQSYTVQHFGTPPTLSGSEDSVSLLTSSGTSPIPPEPPALPPKMNKKPPAHSSNELLPPPSPRPSSHNSSHDDSLLNNVSLDETYMSTSTPGKFPLEDELELMVQQPSPSPVPSQRSESSTEPAPTSESNSVPPQVDSDDIMLHTDVSQRLHIKEAGKEGPEVKGGHPDALIVLATKATKDFAYQEAFLSTYRTWVTPSELFARLVRRAKHFKSRPHELRSTLSLLTRVVADLTLLDVDGPLMQEIMDFIYWLVEAEELPIAKALRQILVDKQKQLHFQHNNKCEYESPYYGAVSEPRDTLLDFKANEIAEQMTLLDAALFVRITTAEVLSWPRHRSEDETPNLTRFTAHFNKMSYWARSRILEEPRDREKYAFKFLKVMKELRKMNNFNSFLALVSALAAAPITRLGWPKAITEPLKEHCAIIDSSSSFRVYRQALAETHPPCIPYIGLVLQDLTFVLAGNPDLLPDGSINFTSRWQQYHIMEANMMRFMKDRQYKLKKNERIQAMFNEFEDVMSEEMMWQVSERIKPSGRTKNLPVPDCINTST